MAQSKELSECFDVVVPASGFERDQASVLMLSKAHFAIESLEDISATVVANLDAESAKMVSPGDLLAVAVDSKQGGPARVVLASFHGDTNGLATLPVLAALVKTANGLKLPLVFGLDANSHSTFRAEPRFELGCETVQRRGRSSAFRRAAGHARVVGSSPKSESDLKRTGVTEREKTHLATAAGAKPGKKLGWDEFLTAVDAQVPELAHCFDLPEDNSGPPGRAARRRSGF